MHRTFTCNAIFNCAGDCLLVIHGWTRNPVTEFYILERFGWYFPITGMDFEGQYQNDGAYYTVYSNEQINKPTPAGVQSFKQIWSWRHASRLDGIVATVTTATHFNAWKNMGLAFGVPERVIVAVEGRNSTGNWNSTGSAGVFIR
jgi:endo-1,4-beta-xylanase